jgi:hypothetical protein
MCFYLNVLTISSNESLVGTVFFTLLLAIFLLIPDIIKWRVVKATTYFVTEEFIGFNFGKKDNDLIKLKDIKDIEAKKDKEGRLTIFFLIKGKIALKTYDYRNLEQRLFPTFESLENGKEVLEILEKQFVKIKLKEEGNY